MIAVIPFYCYTYICIYAYIAVYKIFKISKRLSYYLPQALYRSLLSARISTLRKPCLLGRL